MGVDLQNDGFVYDVFVVATKFIGEAIYIVAHLVEVCKLSTWNFFWENTVGLNVFGNVVETELERSSGNYTVTTGEEIKADNRFKNRRFTGTLRTENCNSWQIDVLLQTNISKFVLKSRWLTIIMVQ